MKTINSLADRFIICNLTNEHIERFINILSKVETNKLSIIHYGNMHYISYPVELLDKYSIKILSLDRISLSINKIRLQARIDIAKRVLIIF